jgi:hypothetical protein
MGLAPRVEGEPSGGPGCPFRVSSIAEGVAPDGSARPWSPRCSRPCGPRSCCERYRARQWFTRACRRKRGGRLSGRRGHDRGIVATGEERAGRRARGARPGVGTDAWTDGSVGTTGRRSLRDDPPETVADVKVDRLLGRTLQLADHVDRLGSGACAGQDTLDVADLDDAFDDRGRA